MSLAQLQLSLRHKHTHVRARAIQQYSVCQNLNANVQVLQNIQFKQGADDIRLQLTAMQVNYNALLHRLASVYASARQKGEKREGEKERKKTKLYASAYMYS